MRLEVEELCELMVKYGLSRLRSGEIELIRPEAAIFAALAAKEKEEPELDEDELVKLRNMTPEAQDAALALAPLKS